MVDVPRTQPVDKTADELRAEFLVLYDRAEKIREKLDGIIRELGERDCIFSEPESDPATTDTVKW